MKLNVATQTESFQIKHPNTVESKSTNLILICCRIMVRKYENFSFSIIWLHVSKRALNFVCTMGTLKLIKKNYLWPESSCLQQGSLAGHGMKLYTVQSTHIIYLEQRLQSSSCHKHLRIRNLYSSWTFASLVLQIIYGLLELCYISYLVVISVIRLTTSVWWWLWINNS